MIVPPRSLGPAATVALAVFVLVLFAVPYSYDATSREMLRTLERAPRASLATPVQGRAVYSGQIMGPVGREARSGGGAVAASWWQVERRNGKSWLTACAGAEQGALVLHDKNHTAAVDFLEGSEAPFIIGETYRNDWETRRVVDLGPVEPRKLDSAPATAGACGQVPGHFREQVLPQGAHVEVYACYAGGRLAACDGPVAGVVSVGTLGDHLARRREDLRSDIRISSMFGLVLVLVFGVGAVAFGTSSFPVLTPRRRSGP